MQLPQPKDQDIRWPMEAMLKSETAGPPQNPEQSQAQTGASGGTGSFGFHAPTALDILFPVLADTEGQKCPATPKWVFSVSLQKFRKRRAGV